MIEDLIPEFTFAGLTFSDDFQEGVYALGILSLFIILNGVVDLLLYTVTKALTRQWQNELGKQLIGAITMPVHVIVFVQGLFVATSVVSALDPWRDEIVTTWGILMTILAAMVIARVVNEMIDWYASYTSSNREANFAARIIPALERIVKVAIYLTAGVLVLDQLGVEISPLIAGLGIGGISRGPGAPAHAEQLFRRNVPGLKRRHGAGGLRGDRRWVARVRYGNQLA